MRKVSGWAFWAVLLMLMEAVGFAQVSSKNANESGVHMRESLSLNYRQRIPLGEPDRDLLLC